MTDPFDQRTMESGNSSELKVALEDVGRTIEWMMDKGSQKE